MHVCFSNSCYQESFTNHKKSKPHHDINNFFCPLWPPKWTKETLFVSHKGLDLGLTAKKKETLITRFSFEGEETPANKNFYALIIRPRKKKKKWREKTASSSFNRNIYRHFVTFFLRRRRTRGIRS